MTSKSVAGFAHLRYSRAGTTRCAQHASGADYRCRSGVELLTRSTASEFAQPSIRALFWATLWSPAHGNNPNGGAVLSVERLSRAATVLDVLAPPTRQPDGTVHAILAVGRATASRGRTRPARIRTPVNSVSSRHIAKRIRARRRARATTATLLPRRSPIAWVHRRNPSVSGRRERQTRHAACTSSAWTLGWALRSTRPRRRFSPELYSDGTKPR